jgi:hypothetical protein
VTGPGGLVLRQLKAGSIITASSVVVRGRAPRTTYTLIINTTTQTDLEHAILDVS